jgi:hypothetical protein
MVSPYPDRERVIPKAQITKAHLKDYIVRNADLLAHVDHYLGGWYNTDDGQVYLDISVRVQTHDEAVSLARQHNQYAYYDLAQGETVHVPGRSEPPPNTS